MTLTRTGFIPIPPGREPGFDHADIYRDGAGGARMYVAHTGADRVDVLDCAAGTWLRALPDHPGVAGILIDAREDLLFTSDRAAARASIYRCSDEALLTRVAVGRARTDWPSTLDAGGCSASIWASPSAKTARRRSSTLNTTR